MKDYHMCIAVGRSSEGRIYLNIDGTLAYNGRRSARYSETTRLTEHLVRLLEGSSLYIQVALLPSLGEGNIKSIRGRLKPVEDQIDFFTGSCRTVQRTSPQSGTRQSWHELTQEELAAQ